MIHRIRRSKKIQMPNLNYGGGSIWSGGYFVSKVGSNELVIQKYIDNQGKEDTGRAELELQ